MWRLPVDFEAISSAFTSGMPPPSSVASVRASCDVANLCMLDPMPGRRSTSRSKRARWPGGLIHAEKANAVAADGREQQPQLPAHEIGDRHDDARRQRQLRAEAAVELRERRHHLDHDDPDQHDASAIRMTG
jgi:hypothetical protein